MRGVLASRVRSRASALQRVKSGRYRCRPTVRGRSRRATAADPAGVRPPSNLRPERSWPPKTSGSKALARRPANQHLFRGGIHSAASRSFIPPRFRPGGGEGDIQQVVGEPPLHCVGRVAQPGIVCLASSYGVLGLSFRRPREVAAGVGSIDPAPIPAITARSKSCEYR